MALSWAVWVIGQEHHVQAELQREIDAYMDEIGDRDLTYVSITHACTIAVAFRFLMRFVFFVTRPHRMEDLGKLEYLDRFCKEALRLYPSVPFILRVRGCAPTPVSSGKV